ncbi:MAG: hypothetical protein LBD77_11680 [Bifidobacteriaceae bacterium]|nr:hypothetical protein [Bifidobacteriaceae bacterium]
MSQLTRRSGAWLAVFAATVAFAVAAPAAPALASTNDDVIDAYDEGLVAFDEYMNNDFTSLAEDAMMTGATEAQAKVEAAAAELQRLAESVSDSGLGERIAELGAGLSDLGATLTTFSNALLNYDDAGLMDSQDQMDAALARLEAAEIAYDTYMEEHPMAAGDTMWFLWTGLLALSVLCLVFAVVMWLKQGRSQFQSPAVKSARRNLLLSAALFAVGAAIPAVQYWTTEPGGEYWIFWYALVVGAIWFVFSVPRFFGAAKKAKQAALAPAPEPAPGAYPSAEAYPPAYPAPGADQAPTPNPGPAAPPDPNHPEA